MKTPLINQQTHRADRWTQIGFITNLPIGTLTNIVTLGAMFHDFTDFEESFWNMSPYGLAFGIIFGLTAALGDAYTEKIINVVHQAKNAEENEVPWKAVFCGTPGLFSGTRSVF